VSSIAAEGEAALSDEVFFAIIPSCCTSVSASVSVSTNPLQTSPAAVSVPTNSIAVEEPTGVAVEEPPGAPSLIPRNSIAVEEPTRVAVEEPPGAQV